MGCKWEPVLEFNSRVLEAIHDTRLINDDASCACSRHSSLDCIALWPRNRPASFSFTDSFIKHDSVQIDAACVRSRVCGFLSYLCSSFLLFGTLIEVTTLTRTRNPLRTASADRGGTHLTLASVRHGRVTQWKSIYFTSTAKLHLCSQCTT